MSLRKPGVVLSLVTLICWLCTTALPINANAAPSVTVTPMQQSQIEFLLTEGHLSNGSPPTYAQALKVVLAYPSVPTMDQYNSLDIGDSNVNSTEAPRITLLSDTTNQSSGNQTVTVEYTWWHGPSYARGLGWNQYLTITFNPKKNKILSRTTKGYWFVSEWCSWLWHYSGEYNSDGYPSWTSGNGIKWRWVAYNLIETFGWGYGPISGQLQMRMFIIGYADGYITGGTF